jgi:hypothetical protein
MAPNLAALADAANDSTSAQPDAELCGTHVNTGVYAVSAPTCGVQGRL